MRRRSRARRGFTLAETLVCAALLILVSVAGVTVTAAVLNAKSAMTEAANSQTLISTALDALANELRFGQELRFDPDTGELTALTSAVFGAGTCFSVEEGIVTARAAGAEGETVRRYELLPRPLYAGLKVTELNVTADGDGFVTIAVAVAGRRDVYSRAVTVRPLNRG